MDGEMRVSKQRGSSYVYGMDITSNIGQCILIRISMNYEMLSRFHQDSEYLIHKLETRRKGEHQLTGSKWVPTMSLALGEEPPLREWRSASRGWSP